MPVAMAKPASAGKSSQPMPGVYRTAWLPLTTPEICPEALTPVMEGTWPPKVPRFSTVYRATSAPWDLSDTLARSRATTAKTHRFISDLRVVVEQQECPAES